MVILAGLFLTVFGAIGYCAAPESGHVWSTWDTIEVDTIASAWLIKNFIDKDVQFKFYPKGELIDQGTAFDTPDAKFMRTQTESTFESLVRQYKIIDPQVAKMGKLVHDIEINYWNKKAELTAEQVRQDINAIIKANPDPAACLQKGIVYFENKEGGQE